ncbi:gas vesicle protein GvpQ [Fictibacillus terranigra]|uniref:Gas vesicle protein GvpQ n=1 Tax=Fictibacillus terranigra TaxID=3058424 RepID=A0ABT8E4Y2_9BACL|nr:gas vesicle protein GvpQ [Fictibacillus sp. CENA-BCM004]MDN4072963.1 gas vesicle protein GvpQ [Fictibacillus sp. CENA-BCM004]
MSHLNQKKSRISKGILIGGMLASSAFFVIPRIKTKAKRGLAAVKVAKNSKIKDKAKEKLKEEAKNHFKHKVEEAFRTKVNHASKKLENATEKNAKEVHGKAKQARDKVRDVLLHVQDKLKNLKKAGEKFQEKISSRNNGTKIKSVNDIKGTNDIKSSNHIKSSTGIKSSKDIKHARDMKKISS